MIAIVATIHVRAERVETFERVARELEREVQEKEPGCLVYRMARDRSSPLTYRNLEIFKDQAAIDYHVEQDYFLAAIETMRTCQGEAPPSVDYMDTLV